MPAEGKVLLPAVPGSLDRPLLSRLRTAARRHRRAVAAIERDAEKGVPLGEQLRRFVAAFPTMWANECELVWREVARRSGERLEAVRRQILRDVQPFGEA